MSAKRRISIGRLLLYSLIMTVVFLLCLEGLARFAYPKVYPRVKRKAPLPEPELAVEFAKKAARDRQKLQKTYPIPMVEHPTRGWVLSPDGGLLQGPRRYVINSKGLRGPEITPLEPGEVRLLTLGDSSIFGDSVDDEEVFSAVAVKLLSERWGRKVTVVNGATPGFTTIQSMRVLFEVGEDVQPSWVVIGNMWSDLYRGKRMAVNILREDWVSKSQKFMRGYALYRFLHRAMSPWLRTRKVCFIESMDDVALGGGQGARVPLAAYIQNLEKLVAMSHKLKARTAFVLLPAPMDLDKVPPPETVLEYRLAMRRVAKRYGAPVLDGPALFKEKGATPGYFFDQVHPSQYGHDLLGRGLADVLEPVGPPPEGKSHYPGVSGK